MENILFNIIINGKRIAVTTDPFNWIILYGSARQSDRTFQKKAHHSYYSNFESMLICLHKRLLRYNLKSLEIDDIIKTLGDAFDLVKKIRSITKINLSSEN